MAVTNLYSNLPGHLVEFKDGGLQLTTSTTDTTSTKSLLILGTAVDGPINEPVKIDATTVSQVFGKEVDANGYPNGATLTKYAKQAFKNGFSDVRCMRVTGSQAYTVVQGTQTTGYEVKQGTVDPSKVTDGSGYIKGNKTFTYKINPEEDDFLPNVVVDSENYITLNGTTNHGLNESAYGISAIPYFGFTLEADKFTAGDVLTLTYRPVQFASFDATGTKTEISADAVVTKSVAGKGTASYDTLLSDTVVTLGESDVTIAEGETTGTAVVTITAHEGANLFVDSNAHDLTDNKIPETTSNGIIYVYKGTATDHDTDDMITAGTATVSFNETTQQATISLSGVAVDDQITVKTLEYIKEDSKTLEVNFEDNVEFEESYITIPDSNVTIVTVKVGDNQLDDDQYTYADDKVTIDGDVSGIVPGDAITVYYTYEEAVTYNTEIKFKSQWGGEVYKESTVKIEKDADNNTIITLKKPADKSNGVDELIYSSKFYSTFDDLILAMNNDINNDNMFEIEIVKGEGTDSLDVLPVTAETAFTNGGESGIKVTPNQMFEALSGVRYKNSDIGSFVDDTSTDVVTSDMVGYLKAQGAYQILENYNVDYIYPAGVYADMEQTVNPISDFQRELALACAMFTYRTKMTHGFIDVKPNSNTTLVGIDQYVNKLLKKHPNVYYMQDADGNVVYDSNEQPMDIGWYTSVVAGPEPIMVSDRLGTYYGSPAIAYAALNANLEPSEAPTNKALIGTQGVKFKFSNKQLNALTGQRFVTFKLKNEGLATASSTPYVVDGMTAGTPACDYRRISTVSIVTDVVNQIREVADPYIGGRNETPERNALSASISKRLGKLVELQEINAYEFEIIASLQQKLLGEATIALTIVPSSELRTITTMVALRAAE